MRRILALVELDVELQPAHAREVVLARVEEHALEQRGRRVQRRRIARPQLAVDLDQRLFRLVDRVALERVGDDVAHVVAIGEEDLEAGRAARQHLVQAVGGQLDVGLDHHFAGVQIHHVGRGQRAIQFGRLHFNLLDRRRREWPSACARVILRPECAISSPLCSTACAGLAPTRWVLNLASC